MASFVSAQVLLRGAIDFLVEFRSDGGEDHA